MRTVQNAIDVSNYSGVITPEQAACLRGRGFAHVIAGTQTPSVTRNQVETAIAAGLTASAYVYLYWRRDVESEVRRAQDTLAGLDVERLWLDCEDGPGAIVPEDIVERIGAAVAACASMPAGIYTGRWWWVPATGNTFRFAHLPLWHAEYSRPGADAPDFNAFAAYGGWSRPAMWQYRGTTEVCGMSADLNLREVEEVPEPVPSEKLELALLRASQRFDRARAMGRYVLRPAGDARSVELQRVENGSGASFDPPYVIEVD